MKNSTPTVSVVMTVFNSVEYIAAAIDSILNQTFTDFELIIINDGSTDNTLDVIKSRKDSRIRLITRSKKGRQYSLDEAISEARGRYVAIMDADDISAPDRLERQVKHMDNHPECVAVSSFIKIIDNKGDEQSPWDADRSNFTPQQIKKTLPKENCIANPASMIRTDILREFGYRHDQVSEDYDLWLRLISSGHEVHKLTLPLLSYRILQSSITQVSIGGSVNRKNFNFKIKYLKDQFRDGKFRLVELRVAWSLVKLTAIMGFEKLRSDMNNALSPYKKSEVKKILFILPWLEMGGADKVILTIMTALKNKNVQIYCVTTVPSKNEWRDYFSQVCVDIADASDLSIHTGIAQFIADYVDSNAIDTVIISNSVSGYVAAELIKSKDASIRILDIIHGQGGKEEKGGIPRHSAPYDKFLDQRIAVTRYMKSYLIEKYGIDNQKISVIHNGVNIPTTSLPEAVRFIENHTDKFLVAWAGRFNVEKHPELVLDIARIVAKKTGNVRFILAGDGDKKFQLISRLKTQELSDTILISEKPYSDYRAFIGYADILLMTSEMEGLPIVILEAFAEKVPVIAPSVGGIPEIVHDNQNGFLVNFNKRFAQEAAKKILLLHQDTDYLHRLGQNGYRLVLKDFTLEKMQKEYLKIILK